jgi:hypothetical protein
MPQGQIVWKSHAPTEERVANDGQVRCIVSDIDQPVRLPNVLQGLLGRPRCSPPVSDAIVPPANEVWIVAARGAVQRPKAGFPAR